MARSQSPGTKTTRSKASSTPGQSKTSSKSSQKQQKKSSPSKNTATRKSTQQKLQENLKTLTSPKEKKKTGKTSGTRKDPGIKAVRSYDRKLFPWETFPYRLDDKRDKKVCHFQCFEHAAKYITRYNMLPKEYKLSYDFHAVGAQTD